MTRTMIGTVCTDEQAEELNRELARMILPTAINAEALDKLNRQERSALYILLRDARDRIAQDESELGVQWEALAQRTMELVARDGVDI
mgnify:CR=1 FL=1